MINKDIERHEQQKNNKENNSNNKVRLEEDSPKNGVLSNEETKGFKKYFIYDTEKISGWKYLIRFFVISLVFVFPTMILKNMEAIFVIILYLCFSYLQSVNAYKRGNALREGWKPMFWGSWGFAVIWISFFLADELKESFWLITGLPHLLLIIINGNKKADPII